jgi:GTPase SAR1 family protein
MVYNLIIDAIFFAAAVGMPLVFYIVLRWSTLEGKPKLPIAYLSPADEFLQTIILIGAFLILLAFHFYFRGLNDPLQLFLLLAAGASVILTLRYSLRYYRERTGLLTLDPSQPPSTAVSEPFGIPEDRWFEGCWMVGASGTGKTNLLRYLILNRLQQDATIIILDSKGDLFKSFHRLQSIKDRLIVLKTTPDYPLAVNPFDAKQPSEFLDYLFGVFNTDLTAQQSIPFGQIINLLEHVPNATMETFWDIIVDGAKNYQQYVAKLHPRDQRFFSVEFNSSQYEQRRKEIQARLRVLFGNKWLGPILESRETKINMRELLDSGKVICIDNSYEDLSELGSEFLGRLFLALIWYAGRERRTQKPVYVFLDEAHYVIANDRHIDDMVTQLRSRRISLTFAHQFLRQIDDDKVRTALNTCAIKFFNTTGEAATAFFPNTSSETLSTIPQGSFATFVKFKTQRAEIVAVPPCPVDRYAQTFTDYALIPDIDYDLMMGIMRSRYNAPRNEPSKPKRTTGHDEIG